jgi:hypothetical protein
MLYSTDNPDVKEKYVRYTLLTVILAKDMRVNGLRVMLTERVYTAIQTVLTMTDPGQMVR